ncbi:hypothetical protein CHRYSEOSP005_14780 [Chryseobacterium sp. Alg-005]
MIVTEIHNVKYYPEDFAFESDVKIGVSMSEFSIEFNDPVIFIDKDHCDCIHTFIKTEDKKLITKIITDKQDIDEFIIFRILIGNQKQNLKIRFLR